MIFKLTIVYPGRFERAKISRIIFMVFYDFIWFFVGFYGFIWFYISFLWFYMVLYKFFIVFSWFFHSFNISNQIGNIDHNDSAE